MKLPVATKNEILIFLFGKCRLQVSVRACLCICHNEGMGGSFDTAVVDIGGLVFCAPQEDSDLAPVHEDEALALVGHVGAQTTAHDAVPSRQVHRVKLCLDDLCDIVQNPALLEGEGHAVDGVLLHVLVHVGILNHCILSVLLVNISMWLDNLGVGFTLPLFGLVGAGVSCNLSN